MARPQTIQLLQHGKALCGAVFGFFVETWNYIAQRCDALVGDRDVNPDEGFIWVDNSQPERPVIRFDSTKVKAGAGETINAYTKSEFVDLKLGAGTADPVTLGKIVGAQAVTIGQKVLEAGSNITLTLSQDGKTITIAATGGSGSTTGFTGTRLTVRDMRYVATPTCQLQVKYNQETWANGVMTATQELAWQLMEGGQAVEETV